MTPKTKVWTATGAAIFMGALSLFAPDLQGFLDRWEGKGQNVVYADKLAKGLPTVCRGITKYTSPDPVVVGEFWSAERCLEVERLVVEKGQLELADCITVSPAPAQHVFDAFTSHGHNFGNPTTCASRAMALLNQGKTAEACRALAWGPNGQKVWAYADGKYVQGLHNRRLAEEKLCLTGKYQ